MLPDADLAAVARALYGERLRGLFAFGSRVAGHPRADSDLDVGVWLDPPLRRGTTWVPWAARFADAEPVIDPTFFTAASLDDPPGWLLEAVTSGVRVLHDPSGQLATRLATIRTRLDAGAYRRRLYMGLPYYEKVAS